MNTPSTPAGFSPWSLTLGSVRGVPVRVHSSFLLLALWVALQSRGAVIGELVFLCLIFCCIAAHEFGHVFAAQSFGIKTRDITLYPFGGVATIMGEFRPFQEVLVALAGPAVNFLFVAIGLSLTGLSFSDLFQGSNSLFVRLIEANFTLGIFNLIPALPMDGGRILRGMLALLRVRNATIIASRISQGMCIILGAIALWFWQPMLLLISVFVFSSAMREVVQEKARLGSQGYAVRDAMVGKQTLQIFSHGMTISEALSIALRTSQAHFPVMLGEQLMGVIDRQSIIEIAATESEEQYVSGLMLRVADLATVEASLPLQDLISTLNQRPLDPLIVMDGDAFSGFLYRDKLFEFVYVHGVRAARAAEESKPDRESPHEL